MELWQCLLQHQLFDDIAYIVPTAAYALVMYDNWSLSFVYILRKITKI